MNKFGIFVICCSLAALTASEPNRKQSRAEISYDYCLDSSMDYLGAATVDVTPYPIHVASGTTLTITANIDVIKAIEVGSVVSLKLTLKGIVDIPIPCLELGDLALPIGSCEYDGEILLNTVSICPDHCPPGQENSLPLNPGNFGGPGFVLTFNDVPAIIEPFLKGEIDVEARIFDGTGAEIICIHTLLEFE